MDAPELSPQEIQALQGTRLSDVPPWMSYGASLNEKLDPRLEQEVQEYSNHYHDKTSAQNEEELARWQEGNRQVAKDYQWVTPEEYENMKPRIGRILYSDEFIRILRNKCGVKCWYRQHPHPDKVTLVILKPGRVEKGDGTRDVINAKPETGCWVQYGWMPEFSIMNFDPSGIPLAEKFRGWRTCLLQLIMKGVLTEEVAHKHFGAAFGPASERYNSVLYGLRNTMKE